MSGLDRLYELLPVVYRIHDEKQGYPLRALLRIINEQADVLEADIRRLYDNWFIETCEDWVVPYIGELVGYRPVAAAGAPLAETKRGKRASRILIPRREVANLIALRRRKGTLALLETLANDAAGWPARAVEHYRLLAWTQNLNHLRPERGGSASLRNVNALDCIDGPFDSIAHTVEVRRPKSHRTFGSYNTPSIVLYLFQLRAYSVTQTPAYCLGLHCFTFSVLGSDTPLYTNPQFEMEATHIAEELNLPIPIRRSVLEEPDSTSPTGVHTSANYYGTSFSITAPDWPVKGAEQPIPKERVIPSDLSDWRYRPPKGYVAVDPVLGRFAFPDKQTPKQGVWVSYHYGFSSDLGGGEYPRTLSEPPGAERFRVGHDEAMKTLGEALDAWRKKAPPAAVIEITDSGVYTEHVDIDLHAGASLQIRASVGVRPVIRLDDLTDRPDSFSLTGAKGSRFTLDGLLVTGRGIQVAGPDDETCEQGDICDVRIRHCTLIPGWGIHCDCGPKRPNEPSLTISESSARFVIEHSITGAIHIIANEVNTDPIEIEIHDSIVDATGTERIAVGTAGLSYAFARMSLVRSTVLGEVGVHAIELAENSIITGTMRVARRQVGCMRFCYVPLGSRTPRRYHCQPDLALAALSESLNKADPKNKLYAEKSESLRLHPRFSSIRYGNPSYCRLAEDCAEEIKRGAEDESEMGAFHELYQSQREAILRARIDEYTPAGMDVGILFAS